MGVDDKSISLPYSAKAPAPSMLITDSSSSKIALRSSGKLILKRESMIAGTEGGRKLVRLLFGA